MISSTAAEKCVVCGGDGELFLEGVKDYFVLGGNSPDFFIRYCAACRIGYSLPRMSDQELSAYYPKDYEAYVLKKSWLGWLQKFKYWDDLKLILRKKVVGSNKSMFEIGAGRGEFLREAREQGFLVAGLEPSETGIQFARDHFNIRLQEGFAGNFHFKNSYSVVAARHVLEHLGDPMECLKKILGEGLSDKGILFLKLPRLDSWEARFFGKHWHGFDIPRHRVHFSRRGIRQILKGLGFHDIEIRSEVVPLDILRSLRFYSAHEKKGVLWYIARGMAALPMPVQMVLAQGTGLLLSPLGTGRMIVLARK